MRRSTALQYLFEGYSLDTDRRELRRGEGIVPVEPQVFDLLTFLVRATRHRVSNQGDVTAVPVSCDRPK